MMQPSRRLPEVRRVTVLNHIGGITRTFHKVWDFNTRLYKECPLSVVIGKWVQWVGSLMTSALEFSSHSRPTQLESGLPIDRQC